MIAETGLAALWLAAGLALFQFVLMVMALRSEVEVARTMRAVAVVQGALTLIAFAALLIVFARTDLSVALVAENSHSAKPFIYKVAGAWGNHEGSMLMWVTILAVAGAFLALLSRRTGERTLIAGLGAQAALALGFYAFLLIASNPFARLNPAPPEGAGLNPLLQDPGLAFHPPTLYVGYVGLSIAFSLAVGALLTGEVDSRLGRAMRPWVLGAWIFLTLGITAGSYWAYYELGWGGYWFWDPVENASLMPWLAATALLHSVGVLAARGALKAWTMMLAVIAFSMSMVGTFLVRSGILTSVHAFAIDPERGAFLLVLLAIYVGAAFALFAWRALFQRRGRTIGDGPGGARRARSAARLAAGTASGAEATARAGADRSDGAGNDDHPRAGNDDSPAARLDRRRLSRRSEHPAADGPQSAARAAGHMGHGGRAFRDRRKPRWHGCERRFHQRAAGRCEAGRKAERGPVAGATAGRHPDGWQELDRAGGRAAREPRARADHVAAADPLFHGPAN